MANAGPVGPVPARPFRAVAENAEYAPQRVAEGADFQHVRSTCAPLMQAATITNILSSASQRLKLICPVFMNTFAPEDYRNDGDYISVVAAACVPEVAGARGEKSALITVQCCAVGYGREHCVTPAEAKMKVMNGLKAKWAVFPQALKDQLVVGDQPPAWVNTNDPIPDGVFAYILEQLARLPEQKPVTIGIFATGLLAFCKQGTVTNNVINKVTNAARDELGMNIQIDANTVRIVWNMIGSWCGPDEAAYFFDVWERAIGEHCLRFRLLVQQASWVGMTNYTNIIKARVQFPNFPWARCVQKFPEDFANFRRAETVVGNNEFYGYRRDLGDAKSTKYPNLCYLAYCLLSQVGGDRTLRDFQGTNRNTPHAAFIDVQVREFEIAHNTVNPDAGPNAEQNAVAANFLAGVPPPLRPNPNPPNPQN